MFFLQLPFAQKNKKIKDEKSAFKEIESFIRQQNDVSFILKFLFFSLEVSKCFVRDIWNCYIHLREIIENKVNIKKDFVKN